MKKKIGIIIAVVVAIVAIVVGRCGGTLVAQTRLFLFDGLVGW